MIKTLSVWFTYVFSLCFREYYCGIMKIIVFKNDSAVV